MARSTKALEADSLALGSDASLAEKAAAGEVAAFEELYRRHSQAAWRVAQSVTGNRDDAADAVAEAFTKVFQALPAGRLHDSGAFRPYLLSATRNAALDVLRRAGRLRPSDTMEQFEQETPHTGPSDRVVDLADQSMVAAAFLSLPERWRSVLWLTEVEGVPPREAAEVLGLSPNGVAQLAVRARAGLRDRYLQAHLRDAVPAGCQFTVAHLGAYVGGGLSPRDIAKVDQHLAGCADCRRRQEELEDLGGTLRRAALPIPLALAAMALTRFKAASGTVAGIARPLAEGTAHWLHRTSILATGTLAALGLIGLAIVGDTAQPLSETPVRERELVAPAVEVIPDPDTELPSTDDQAGTGTGNGADSTSFTGELTSLAAPIPSVPLAPLVEKPVAPSEPEEPAGPVVQLDVRLGPGTDSLGLGVGLGDGSCLGVDLAGTAVGCQPAGHDDPAALVTLRTGGGVLGDNTISL